MQFSTYFGPRLAKLDRWGSLIPPNAGCRITPSYVGFDSGRMAVNPAGGGMNPICRVLCANPEKSPGHFRAKSAILAMSLALGFVLALAVSPSHSQLPQILRPKHAEYRIAVHCSRGVLQLWKQTELVREYPVECGKAGVGKQRGGDRKTPVGDYEITWMASRGGAKGHRIIDGQSWCKKNRFVYAATGPAIEKLWSDSYGGLEAAIMSIDYPNEKDSLRGFTGGCIHIHGDKHQENGMLRKSLGCIHMFPSDANDLYDFVDEGTPVKILP